MATYNVINVGQGDCMIIEPTNDCLFRDQKIIIDLGAGERDISEFINDWDSLHIFFTHHHKDHLGGLRFIIDRFDQIKEITFPLYQNEITLIARAILNLKGINTSRDCNEFINELKNIVSNQVELVSLTRKRMESPILSFAYQDKSFCNHIECFNPPKIINTPDLISNANESELIALMNELFTRAFAREMEIYLRAQIRRRYDSIDYPNFYNYWLYQHNDERSNQEESVFLSKCNFVLNFIIDNLVLLKTFNEKSNRKNLRNVYSKFVEASHNVCIVLKTNYDGVTMLHTGDASKKVFNRLIRENKDISANYLKMPHHGSKYNISRRILNSINPEIAIISHDNGHFGRADDTHPNLKTIDWLNERNISILVTNDVIKNNITIIHSSCGYEDDYIKVSE